MVKDYRIDYQSVSVFDSDIDSQTNKVRLGSCQGPSN